jgi:hypothetical protein
MISPNEYKALQRFPFLGYFAQNKNEYTEKYGEGMI